MNRTKNRKKSTQRVLDAFKIAVAAGDVRSQQLTPRTATRLLTFSDSRGQES